MGMMESFSNCAYDNPINDAVGPLNQGKRKPVLVYYVDISNLSHSRAAQDLARIKATLANDNPALFIDYHVLIVPSQFSTKIEVLSEKQIPSELPDDLEDNLADALKEL